MKFNFSRPEPKSQNTSTDLPEINSRRKFLRQALGLTASFAVDKLSAKENTTLKNKKKSSIEEDNSQDEDRVAEYLLQKNGIKSNEIDWINNTLENNARIDNLRIFDDWTSVTFSHYAQKMYYNNSLASNPKLIKMIYDSFENMSKGVFYQVMGRDNLNNPIKMTVRQDKNIFGIFKNMQDLQDFMKGKSPDIKFIEDIFLKKNRNNKLFEYYNPIETNTSPYKKKLEKQGLKSSTIKIGNQNSVKVYLNTNEEVSKLNRDGIFIAGVKGKRGYIVLKAGTLLVTEKGTNKILAIAACNNPIFAGGLEPCPVTPRQDIDSDNSTN